LTWYVLTYLQSAFPQYISDISQQTEYIIVAVDALFLGLLLLKLTQICIFLLGGIGGIVIGNLFVNFLMANWNTDTLGAVPENMQTIKLIILGAFVILGGVLSGLLVKHLLIQVLTSMVGGYLCTGPVDYALYRWGLIDSAPLSPSSFLTADPNQFICSTEWQCWAMLSLWAVVWGLGIYVQFKYYKPNEEDEKKKYDDDGEDAPHEIVIRHVYDEDDDEEDPEKPRQRRNSKKGLGERRSSKGGRRGSKDLGSRRDSKGRRNSKDKGRRGSKGGGSRRGSKDNGRRNSKDNGRRKSK